MKQLYLGLAIHNHQPVGNFPWVFEDAYRQAYLPMLEALERYRSIRLSLHYSGCLIDWLQTNHPDFIARLVNLVQRGQVEIMGGGYYEPILPAIPDADKLGQIEKMNRWAVETFGQRPTGMWLAERVWEPQLPKFAAEAGIQWTVVDDTHFKMVGLNDKDLFGYYVTEEQGHTLRVYGTSKHLRYVIPWGRVAEVIDYLRSEATDNGIKIAVMGDDGEKFGNWPGTYDYCWKKGWVERFFRALEHNSDWLHMLTLGEYTNTFPALGRVYLPTASYAEMMEWALPAEESYLYGQITHQLENEGRSDITKFMRGGLWRNFLVKYPEVNSMHKKMLWVHKKVWRHIDGQDSTIGNAGHDDSVPQNVTLEDRQTTTDGKASPTSATILDQLWQGQCNCPYWHGVFGGSYMTDIRAELYRHLITAEDIVDQRRHDGQPWASWTITDFDYDSHDELLVETDRMNLYFQPSCGGRLFEWDWRPGHYNLISTITRRLEAYHLVLKEVAAAQQAESAGTIQDDTVKNIHSAIRAKELGLEKRLWYDWYERRGLIDHFLHPTTALENFAQAAYGEEGDFVNQPYDYDVNQSDHGLTVRLGRSGHVWNAGMWLPFRVEKVINLSPGGDEIAVDYTVTNESECAADVWFGVESNFNLLGGGHNDAARYHIPGVNLGDSHLDSTGETANVTTLTLSNSWLNISVTMCTSEPATLWRFPIETVGNSEAGFERVYQSSCALLHWKLHLDPGQSWKTSIECGCRQVESVV